MPSVSKAQARAMFAAAEGNSTLGIPKSVGQEFTAAQTPGSIKRLPEHVAAPKGSKSMKSPAQRKPFGSFSPS